MRFQGWSSLCFLHFPWRRFYSILCLLNILMYNLSLAIIINVRRLHEIKTLCKCLQPSVERITQRRFTANFPLHTANFAANQVHLRKNSGKFGSQFVTGREGIRSAPEWWRRQTGDANVHKFAPQPNWARGPYWCSFARCAESEVEEVEAADATLSNVNSSKSSNWGDFSGVHFGSSIYPAFDRALLFHIWGFLKWKSAKEYLVPLTDGGCILPSYSFWCLFIF